MSDTYNVLENGQVVNTIIADEAFMAANYSEYELVVAEEYEEDDPIPRKKLTRYEFRSQFTTAEKVAMYDSTDTIIKIFLDDIQAAEYIDVTDQATIDGVAYLEAQGLIAAGRSADILAGIPQ